MPMAVSVSIAARSKDFDEPMSILPISGAKCKAERSRRLHYGARPSGRQIARARSIPLPVASARPVPLLCPFHQFGTYRVPFPITQHGEQVCVLFDGKSLEASLPDVAAAM